MPQRRQQQQVRDVKSEGDPAEILTFPSTGPTGQTNFKVEPSQLPPLSHTSSYSESQPPG